MKYHAISMKYDSVILDIDGTLWNAAPTTLKSMHVVYKKHGIVPLPKLEEISAVSGKPVNDALQTLIGKLEDRYPGLQEKLETAERELLEQEGGVLYDGVLEGCRKLSAAASVFLCSNCGAWYLDVFLEASRLKPLLTGWVCYGLSPISKGLMIKGLMDQNNLQKPVFVGDTSIDLEAAQEAGVDFVGASYGFGDVSRAKNRFATFPEITEFILRS